MSKSEQKVVQYLERGACQRAALVSVLRSQIAMTPGGSYRAALGEAPRRDPCARPARRRPPEGDRGGRNPLGGFVGLAEPSSARRRSRQGPVDLLRGSGGEEKLLKNAKDACATEALEIATYTALERLAAKVGDEQTAKLAASIRGDEERMLARVLREIPKLTDAVVAPRSRATSYDVTTTGAADAVREVADATKQATKTTTRAKRTARQARKVPGVAQAEGQIKGAVASEEDLAIARYDSLTAEEIVGKLPELSQIELAKIDSYERKNDNRTTVLSRVSARGERSRGPAMTSSRSPRSKPCSARRRAHAKGVAAYERAHKNRAGVLRSAERETANA